MSIVSPESANPKENIIIKGAKVHNLKNIDVVIPRNKFVVITGVSGSGKSSLAFDTLYAEGQRRYVESLSAYARQFLGKLDKPDVDYIKGISPAIAIEQKVNTRNPRSTVGTSTEIYDYLKLLFARIGKTFSPVSGQQVKRETVDDVAEYIHTLGEGTKISVFSPIKIIKGRTLHNQLTILQQQGFSRVKYNGRVHGIEDLLKSPAIPVPGEKKTKKQPADGISRQGLFLLIDRVEVKHGDEDNMSRISDSLQTAFYEGEGDLEIEIIESPKGDSAGPKTLTRAFSNRFDLDGIRFEEPSVHFFSFNNPMGACKTCEGFGSIIGIDEDLVVPNKSLSVFEEAIVCWKGEKMSEWKNKLILNNHKFGFPIHKPFKDLTDQQKKLLWTGNQYFRGLNDFFKHLEHESYKIQYRVMLSRYRGKTVCYDCRGTRLRSDANYVKVAGKSITEIVMMQVKDALAFFETIAPGHPAKEGRSNLFSDFESEVSKRLFVEIINRLKFLNDVGLGYLTLNRLSSTLSGGESQRINLATSLGSSLVGSMYILDEPSIGLHPRDTHRLIRILQSLRKLGNTVIVVEHDEEIIKQADKIIDLGPDAGSNGGEVVFQGPPPGLQKGKTFPQGIERSLSLQYLTGKKSIDTPAERRKWKNYIEVTGANENNLKNISVKIPLETMTVVTGVSGSGKSSLVKNILYPALKKIFERRNLPYAMENSQDAFFPKNETSYTGDIKGRFDEIKGDFGLLEGVEFVDQNPIGKSSRSNPVTYIKAYDEIRALFSEQKLAKARNYKPSHFSFNVDGGRCEVCEGEGRTTVEMQFMADVHLVCEECKGKRFRSEILEVEYNGKNISDVLSMTVDNAIDFFSSAAGKTGEHTAENPSPSPETEPFEIQPAHGRTKEAVITGKLKSLRDVGLGYVQLGQASNTLSGGEAQRIKLASFMGSRYVSNRDEYLPQARAQASWKSAGKGMLFIFDEPTTGLHFHDIKKLLKALNALIEQGHSVLIIEHNPEVIKCADWVIDLGPEGGEEGGHLVFEGTPEELARCEKSYTGDFLKKKLP